MMRELLIMRHGKARRPVGVGDFERPISDTGKRAAQRMGIWLLRNALAPDHIISSPAKRAIETTAKLCKAMGMGVQGIIQNPRIYEASLRDLLTILRDIPAQARRVLLVGHNPGLQALVTHLDGGGSAVLSEACLARLELPDDWKKLEAGCGRLASIIQPGQLPEKFPFPGPGSTELRDRPAYYYTQSSVIPYRLNNGELEILIIGSSKRKHWVVPKGIKDPGLSPQDAAAKEAFEEAGIEGTVGAEPLGSYVYNKWGATCTCHVYAMEVTRIFPEDEWEERHRGRLWVSPQQAAAKLKQPELGALISATFARKTG